MSSAKRRTAEMRLARPRVLTATALVTVVVPCYNYGHYLRDSVGSVLSQEGVELQVIIVDDASPDGSVGVARELAREDPRITVIEHPENRGHIRTYNDGLAAATGEYVVLLSADDMLTPGSLARSVALMQAFPEVGLVYGNPVTFEDTPPEARDRATGWSIWSGRAWVARLCSRGHNVIFTPEVVMRRTLLADLGGYDARLPHSADMHLWLRAAARSSVGRVNGADQAFYRVHGGNMHIQKYGELLADITERSRAFDLFFDAEGSRLGGAPRLRARARRSLARDSLWLGREHLDSGGRDVDAFARCLRKAEELRTRRVSPAARVLDVTRRRRALADLPPSPLQRLSSRSRGLQWRVRWRRWHLLGT